MYEIEYQLELAQNANDIDREAKIIDFVKGNLPRVGDTYSILDKQTRDVGLYDVVEVRHQALLDSQKLLELILGPHTNPSVYEPRILLQPIRVFIRRKE